MNFLIFLQESISPLADSLATAGSTGMHPVGHFSIMEQLMKGWYIYLPQLLMSVIAVYVIIERTLTVNRADKEEASFMQRIKEYINQGKLDSAKNLCSTSGTPTARMIEKGISRIGKPVEDIKKAIEMVGKLETAKLDRNVSILATIAGIAPVFGFLGTVFGVIVIFRDIAEAGSLQIGTVSEGLYLKMISSAVGLIVFMIAYIGYNHLVTRVNKVVNKMEANAVEFLDVLEQPTA
ncbi:MAG: MotA/TolQ/ExbB proton channel family protein [Flavobacteriales bacterium]|jgi:biopolymer transport protein ExbB